MTRPALDPDALRVGVSVSEPAEADLVGLGLSEMHVRHAFIETMRHLLACGWLVAYGGDFRKDGYTEALFDLVRTYNPHEISGPDRVLSYLAWPLWLDLTPADRAEIANIATLIEVPAPDGAPDRLPPIKERKPADLLWNSLALGAMREQMTANIDARLVLGGRLFGQQGIYPGVLEEAALALQRRVPLFVAGGFGGCGRAIAEALAGSDQPELTIDYQLEHTPRYRELLEAAKEIERDPDFPALGKTFASVGFGGLRNGLSEDENQRQAGTNDVDEIIALALRGLRQIATVTS